MKKLELKHLAPYLPYRLKIYINVWRCEQEVTQLRENAIVTKKGNHLHFDKFKPILRPLSDLTDKRAKELFGNNYSSVKCEGYAGTLNIYTEDTISLNLIHYIGTINKLFENHFDVFGLIDAGLAIDINTLGK